ncbi:hypothetical protein HDV00_005198 [Rhizophlyctis rosea]|nr:hypothetical protein HDV00_005198 [Rhizophlyctis rosea]
MFCPKTITIALLATLTIAHAAAAPKISPSQYLSVPITRCDTPDKRCHKLNTGIVTEGAHNITADGFVPLRNGVKQTQFARAYLFDMDSWKYYLLKLKNRMLYVDVNIGGVYCGQNAAFYFSPMPENSQLGTGYCDAQGTCNEIDIMEGNAATKAYSMHPCNQTENGYCAHQGCNVNTNRDQHNIVGPGLYINTSETFTLLTAFRTHDNTDTGDLVGVQQYTYTLQNGKAVAQTLITDKYCTEIESWNTNYTRTGGLKNLGNSFDLGQVLVFSFWGNVSSAEYGNGMSWLDQGVALNARCNQTVGENAPSYTNIRVDFMKDIKATLVAPKVLAVPSLHHPIQHRSVTY